MGEYEFRTHVSPPYVWPTHDGLFEFIQILTERLANQPTICCEMAIRHRRSSRTVRRPRPSTMTAGFG